MDEIQVLIPVAVKSKLTEALNTTLLNQINQNIKSVENDMTQLEFEANAKLAEQAKINMQAVAPLRAQYDAQKAQMIQVKDKLTADKEHLEKLTIGAELPRQPLNRLVTLHIGDDMNAVAGGEILVEDGKIIADDEPRKVGEFLRGTNDEMFAAMPSPVRIYYEVGSELECPLTVREGRSWLSEMFAGKEITERKLPEIPEKEEIGTPAVIVKEAWFRYEKNGPDILRGLSFSVPKGKIFAIVGGNGTGKSTTLRAICNICRPYRGQILIDGKRIEKYKGAELFKNNLAMLPQDPQSLFVKKTVREDLREMISGSEENIKKAIQENTSEAQITYLSKEEQLNEVKAWLGDEADILNPYSGEDNPFKPSLIIKVKKNVDIQKIVEAIQDMPGIYNTNTYINQNPYELFLFQVFNG